MFIKKEQVAFSLLLFSLQMLVGGSGLPPCRMGAPLPMSIFVSFVNQKPFDIHLEGAFLYLTIGRELYLLT